MSERKCVKFRVNMYEDTKFKIIDMKPERDLIHYVWTRFVILAGKVNLEGDLYLSKTIPYTIETLAIEFNRDVDQIKLALELFIELEMIELTEGNIYKVKNFAKHQNIKVKEKNISEDKAIVVKDKKVQIEENFKNDNYPSAEKAKNVSQNIISIRGETEKNKTSNRKKNSKNQKDKIEEENEDDVIVLFNYGDKGRPLGKGESITQTWNF